MEVKQTYSNPKTYPVVEIFGPTVQGEGPDQGVRANFIRFGGCDFKCSWCDTPHAVLPQFVKTAPKFTSKEIDHAVRRLPGNSPLVILTGGNPVLHDLKNLVSRLKRRFFVSVETQGTMYKPWVEDVDRLCVSPKPPSSGMEFDLDKLDRFCDLITENSHRSLNWGFLKIVVFDLTDLKWAKKIHYEYPSIPMYLSAGNNPGPTISTPDKQDTRQIAQVRNDLLDKSKWLVTEVLRDSALRNVVVQSQYHVLLWGNELGR